MAIISLIAVLCAALEHEDLILQEREPPGTCRGGDEREAVMPVARAAVTGECQPCPGQTGTEGTFRADKHVMQIFQRELFRDELKCPLFVRPLPATARRWGDHAVWRPAIVGVVELRL